MMSPLWATTGRLVLTVLILSTSSLSFARQTQAQDSAAAPQTLAELKMARREFKKARNLEYPSQLRKMAHRITLAEAQLASLKRQIREYERYPRSNFFWTRERLRFEKQAAELHVRQLRHEQLALQIHIRDKIRDRRQQLQEAAAELETVR